MSLRIALDARTVYSKNRRGTGKNLLDAYRELAQLRSDWQFHMFHQESIEEDPFHGHQNVVARRVDMIGDRFDWWHQLRLPLAARSMGVLHCPANRCPRRVVTPLVTTIHDLIPLRISDPLTDPHREQFATYIQQALQKSTRIIAVSENTKSDLISDFNADASKIDVLTWAPDAAYAPVQDEASLARVKARYNTGQRFVLAFSGQTRRKNADGMIRGFARLDQHVRSEVRFVFVGVEPQSNRDRLQQLARELGVAECCVISGFAAEDDIPALLSAADLLAFCSLYEGFGLPILDAFACETAVLTSNVSSMPEVAGDAAVLCDPDSTESIAEGMHTLLTNEQLRAELVAKGTERLRSFNWRRTAQTLSSVFEACQR